jgi:hypothetical protein
MSRYAKAIWRLRSAILMLVLFGYTVASWASDENGHQYRYFIAGVFFLGLMFWLLKDASDDWDEIDKHQAQRRKAWEQRGQPKPSGEFRITVGDKATRYVSCDASPTEVNHALAEAGIDGTMDTRWKGIETISDACARMDGRKQARTGQG